MLCNVVWTLSQRWGPTLDQSCATLKNRCRILFHFQCPGLYPEELSLTSVFLEGLSFMVVGQNPTCGSTFALAAEVEGGWD